MALEADFNTMGVLNESQYEYIDQELHTAVMNAANLLLKDGRNKGIGTIASAVTSQYGYFSRGQD
eukprot:8023552-Ditylum_brightwellii.AAC.1